MCICCKIQQQCGDLVGGNSSPDKRVLLLPAASAVQHAAAASTCVNMSTCPVCSTHLISCVSLTSPYSMYYGLNTECTHLWKRICIAECLRLKTVVNLLLQLVTDFNWEHHDKCHVDISILATSSTMCQLVCVNRVQWVGWWQATFSYSPSTLPPPTPFTARQARHCNENIHEWLLFPWALRITLHIYFWSWMISASVHSSLCSVGQLTGTQYLHSVTL